KDIGKITITAGVATYPDDGNTVDEIISKADKFLYLGKVRGRNMVVNSTPVDSTPVDTNIVSENSLLQDIAQH
ncbi:MAG: diguanylate cyclase, partial [Candidatus Brocadiales bacterium]|nr:diguanylate cyclase [Candidatus Brocadiales bacterium]